MRSSLQTLGLTMLLVSVGLWAADDVLLGTWKLNLAKSKFNPGPPPKSVTHLYEPYESNGEKFTSEGTDGQEASIQTGYAARYDGTDYALTGDPICDSVSMRRIDANTTEVTGRKAGRVIWTSRRVVSKDGRTLTVTQKGTNPQGKSLNNVMVFDKQ